MGFSTLITGKTGNGGKFSSRQGADVDHIIVHGMASTSYAGVLAMVADPNGRSVSANYFISNEGKIHGCVDETLRAWTSGSPSDGGKGAAWDRRSVTVEVENSTGAPGWGFSTAAKTALAELMADVSARHKFPLTRTGKTGTVLEHRELWSLFNASYPTACPQSMPTDAVVVKALAITKGTKENVMNIIKPNTALRTLLGADQRILTDLRYHELVTNASRIELLEFASTRTDGPPSLVFDKTHWDKVLTLPAFPTGGAGGGATVDEIDTKLAPRFAHVEAAIPNTFTAS